MMCACCERVSVCACLKREYTPATGQQQQQQPQTAHPLKKTKHKHTTMYTSLCLHALYSLTLASALLTPYRQQTPTKPTEKGLGLTEHELSGVAPEGGDTGNATSDGTSDLSSQQQGTQELEDCRDDDSCPQLESLGAHTGSKGVGHIIGAWGAAAAANSNSSKELRQYTATEEVLKLGLFGIVVTYQGCCCGQLMSNLAGGAQIDLLSCHCAWDICCGQANVKSTSELTELCDAVMSNPDAVRRPLLLC